MKPRDERERRVALVTGGTRGIGFGCARALAAEGWDLALCGVRDEADVRPPLEELRGVGGAVHYLKADIGDDRSPGLLTDGVRDRFGRLDLLVNNAGVAPMERRDILEASPESFDRVLRTNLRGPYFLTQAAARLMMEPRGGDPSTGDRPPATVRRLSAGAGPSCSSLPCPPRWHLSTAASTASPRPA